MMPTFTGVSYFTEASKFKKMDFDDIDNQKPFTQMLTMDGLESSKDILLAHGLSQATLPDNFIPNALQTASPLLVFERNLQW